MGIQEGENLPSLRLTPHVIILALFSAAAVLIRGVRWDETYERAQVLLGLVQYPPGHPLLQYAYNAFSLQYHLGACMYRLVPSAYFLCGIRQVCAVAATVIPVFLLTALISRRILAGYVAAVLALAGALTVFASYYPIFNWPDKFTCGHIGMGFMLLVLYLLLAGKTGPAWLGLGMAPAVHIGQTPVLFLVMLVSGAYGHFKNDSRIQILRILPWLMVGVAISAGTWFYIHVNSLPAPDSGPYAANPEQAVALWRGYSHGEDIHRVFPRFNPLLHSHLVAAMAIALGGLALLRLPRGETRRNVSWLFLYCAMAVAVFYGVMAAEAIFGGANLPPLLTIWMPYRLLNHAAVILLAMAVGIAAMDVKTTPVLAAAAALPAVIALSEMILPESFLHGYLVPECAIFLLIGAACAVLTTSRVATVAVVAGIAALSFFHQFGAACMAAGFVISYVTTRHTFTRINWNYVSAGFVAASVLALLGQQWVHREVLPVSEFQRQVKAYLTETRDATAMLLTPHWDINYQEATDHAVLYTFETPQLLTYMPEIAPAVINMRRDIYDIVLGRMWDYSLDGWKSRTRLQWEQLARDYGFRYVISPNQVPLDLEPVVTGKRATMYVVNFGDT